MIPGEIFSLALIELCTVSFLDLKFRKIKNSWSLLNIALATACFFLYPEVYIFSWDSFQFSCVILLVGFGLFLLKIMGGGDSKFLSTFFLLIPVAAQDLVFSYLLAVTVVIGLGMLIFNTIRNYKKLILSLKTSDIVGVKNCFGTKFPYAPVILLAWILTGYKIFL